MSQHQSLELNLNIHNNPTNFKEQHNIGERIIFRFILVHKRLDSTSQSCRVDNLLIMNRKEMHRNKG
jgi:hypothetical protein